MVSKEVEVGGYVSVTGKSRKFSGKSETLNTSNIKSIRECSDGSFIVETNTSYYRLEIKEKSKNKRNFEDSPAPDDNTKESDFENIKNSADSGRERTKTEIEAEISSIRSRILTEEKKLEEAMSKTDNVDLSEKNDTMNSIKEIRRNLEMLKRKEASLILELENKNSKDKEPENNIDQNNIDSNESIPEESEDAVVLENPSIDNEGSEDFINVDFKVIETPEEQLARLVNENRDIESLLIKETLNEESGESSYEKADTGDKILMILGKKANLDRRNYLEKDYEMDKNLGGIKRFFGRVIKTDKYEEEIAIHKDAYEKSREEYKDALLKFQGISDKGDAEIIARDFQINEQLRWRSDKIDVAMENSPIYEKFKGYSLDMINRYRKLRGIPGEKISKLTGSKLIGLSAGAAITGGLISSSGIGAPLRIFSAAVATVGYKQMLESFAERSRLKKSEKEVKGAIENFENSYEDFDSWLSEKNKSLHENIQDEKLWRNYRTLIAGGAALGTMFGGSWAGEKIAGYFGGGVDSDVVSKNEGLVDSGNEIKTPEKIVPVQAEAPHGSGLHSGPTVAEATSSTSEINSTVENVGVSEKAVEAATIATLPESGKIDLNIEKGSSVEKTLKEFLMEHKNDFKEGKMGWSEDKFANVDDWAGRRAHLIAQEFAKENPGRDIDMVHPDTELKLSISSDKTDIKIGEINDPFGPRIIPDSVKSAPEVEVAKEVLEAASENLDNHAAGFIQRLEIDSDHYAEIKNMSVKSFVEELRKTGNLEYGGEAMDIRLPDGDFAGSGYIENRRLGVIMSYLVENGKIGDPSQSIEEALKNIKEEDFMRGVGYYEGIFGDIPGVENIPDSSTAQVEATETAAKAGTKSKLPDQGKSVKPEGIKAKPIPEEKTTSSSNENVAKHQEAVVEKTSGEKIRQEMIMAKTFGFSSEEYSAIDDVSISRLIQEIPAKDDPSWSQYKSANSYSPDLPSDGVRGWSEFKKQESLADFFRAYNKSSLPKINGDMTIGEFFRQVDANSLAENNTFKLDINNSDFGSDKDYEAYLQRFTETEILEVRKMLVNSDLKIWRELRGKVIKDIDNESFSDAYAKVGKILGLKDVKGEGVEKWTTRIAKAAYEQGKMSEVKEVLKTVTNKTTQ